jgi:hypothetical protein
MSYPNAPALAAGHRGMIILDKMGVDSRLAIACFVHDLNTRLN